MTLFPTTDDGNARMGDPASSHRTVKSIVRDGSLAKLILDYAQDRVEHPDEYEGAFNDTSLWMSLELATGRRFQRNVLARARGRLVNDGYLVALGPRMWAGEELEHFRLATADE